MKIIRTIISCMLCFVLTLTGVFTVSAAEQEYVEFGSYPQREVIETPALKNATYNEYGDTLIDGVTYRRILDYDKFRYFAFEPVTWYKYGNILVAKDAIECKMYDEQEEKIKNFMGGVKYADSVTWEECSLRDWLNDEFLRVAFTEEQQAKLADEVRLFTVDEAKSYDKSALLKTPSEYAAVAGVRKDSNGYCEWLLKDISPIVSSTVCTVMENGKINTGMTVLVNEQGKGVVPCITINNFDGLNVYTGIAPEKKTELYYPGGRTAEFTDGQITEAIASGWYTSKADAMKANASAMKARFQSSALNELYDWRLYASTSTKGGYIIIEAPQLNITPSRAIEFIKPIMDTFYTGNINDYMEVHVEFTYDKTVAATFDQFTDTIGKALHEAVEGCWSGWGNIICSDGGIGRLTGTSGALHTATLRLKINGNGSYSLENTAYHDTLHKLAAEAMAYSQRPLGQIQYLRHFYGQNTIYEGSLFTNEPTTLLTKGEGVCGTYANFTADFCKLLGIPCIIYTNEKAAHAWNGIYLEGKWYHMDHTGTSDKEYMQNYYSNYSVNSKEQSFNPNGFPSDHTAENVNFLMDSYYPVDNLTETEINYLHKVLAGSGNASANKPLTDIPPANEPQKEISVLLNGSKLSFDVKPIIENGRTLVPMRKIFESLGATVYWNADTFTVTGVKDTNVVIITVDSAVMVRNGQNINLDVPARLVDGRTLVPVRVIAESFGLDVDWDAQNFTVIIK